MNRTLLALAVTVSAVPAARAQVFFDQGIDAKAVVAELAPAGIRRHVGWTPACRNAAFGAGLPDRHTFVLRSLEILEECSIPNPSSPGGCTFFYENPVAMAFQVVDARSDRSKAEAVKVCFNGLGTTASVLRDPRSAAVSITPAGPGQTVVRLSGQPRIHAPLPHPAAPREETQAP